VTPSDPKAPPGERRPLAEAVPTPWLPPVVALFVTFFWRVVLIQIAPVPYSFDAYQRWAGRGHILVQDWLPATQTLIWATARLGGNLLAGRLVMSAVAALAASLGTLLAMRIARARHAAGSATWAGWAFVVAAFFGPWCSWGTVFYQESTFLAVLFAGLLLATGPSPRLGDATMGLLGLVRYEGWPCIVLYALWRSDALPLAGEWLGGLLRRRRPEGLEAPTLAPVLRALGRAWAPALVASWGMILWIVLRLGGVEGYHASPVNFADWEGLASRFTIAGWLHDARSLAWRFTNSGGLVWLTLGAFVAWRERRSPLVQLLTLMFLSQIGITFAWLAGLEVSTSRMLVIPVVLAAVLGAVAAPTVVELRLVRLRSEAGTRFRLGQVDPAPAHGLTSTTWSLALVVPLGLMVVLGVGLEDARLRMRVEGFHVRMETAALTQMKECPGCVWWVLPRRGLGTRARHDGCEVLQGTSDLLEGEQFYCAPWVAPDEALKLYASCSGTVRWNPGSGSYVLERHLPGTESSMPVYAQDAAPAEEEQHDE